MHDRVSGVSFRAGTQQEAKDLELTGWVANTDRQTVVGVAEGHPEDMRELCVCVIWCTSINENRQQNLALPNWFGSERHSGLQNHEHGKGDVLGEKHDPM